MMRLIGKDIAEELAARILVSFKKQLWRRRKEWNMSPLRWSMPADGSVPVAGSIAPEHAERIIREADQIVSGQYTMLGNSFYEPMIDWFLDPASGKRAPVGFGPCIKWRNREQFGDIRRIWAKNRHEHLITLALAYTLTQDRRYVMEVRQQLVSWSFENPFPSGINWASPREAGIRLVAWIWIERLLRGSSEHRFLFGENGILWPLVYWHQWLIAECDGPDSVDLRPAAPEMAGLYISALVWPYFPESHAWRQLAREKLEKEAGRQFASLGAGEARADWSPLAVELYACAALEGECEDDPYSQEFKDRIRFMRARAKTAVGGEEGEEKLLAWLRLLISGQELEHDGLA